jgi:hypothetical protein
VLDGGHPGPGVLVRDGQRDGARAAAQVHDDRTGEPGEAFQRPLDQQFGLRAGHEHPGADGELEQPERCPAGQVLERHPVGALVEQGGEPGGVVVGDVREREQPGARAADDVGQQQLGVDPRGVDAGVGQAPRGIGEERARVQEPAASSSAVCALLSASITASRSPSSTWSRLCDL